MSALLTLVMIAGLTLSATPPATAKPQPLSGVTTTAVSQIMASLMTRSGSSDPRYFSRNVWYDGSPDCFRCTFGPAVLAAQHGVRTGSGSNAATKAAIGSFDLAIKNHQRRDGAFGPAAPGEGGLDIQTVLFANELAQAYLLLGNRLDAAHKKQWSASLTKASDWLIGNGNLKWYINGNLNLAIAINMDLTYRITKASRFKTAAASSLSFLLNPPQQRWKGFGMQYTKKPKKADGSDGAGFLAESGGKDPGYDPAYTLVQTNLAAFWYLLTGSPDAKRLTNLTYNQLLPRVRKSDWTLDVSGGTRRMAPGIRYRFSTSALPVLALKGGRTDLQKEVQSQLAITLKDYKGATTYQHAAYSFSFGSELTPIYLVLTQTKGW